MALHDYGTVAARRRPSAIDDEVTVEHLLAHRSGIGDYFDEEAGGEIDDYVLPVPVHELATTEQLPRRPRRIPEKFAARCAVLYCNGGYVVLALLAERASRRDFADLVHRRSAGRPVCGHAFLRSDDQPRRAALGYLDANGPAHQRSAPARPRQRDGGIFSTVADIHVFWVAFFAGKIVAPERVAEMVTPE